ncbi:MAG: fibronectin type III domain-containing protein, partial [Actinomycetota bacterium]
MSTLTVSSLGPNTTYFFRIATLNWNNLPNYASAGSTSTLANPVTIISPAFLGVFSSSITARWAALPLSPSSSTSEGYLLEASSTNFNGTGTILSSSTPNVALSTLTVSGLLANTTYFFRVGSLNWNSVANYLSLGSTSTLANVPGSVSFSSVFVSSASLTWTAPSGAAEGYQLQASSTNFNGTGSVLSSTTANGSLTALTVSGLLANTTYFFRVGSLNWNNAVNYAAAITTSTLADLVVSPSIQNIFLSSAALTWSIPSGGAEGYEIQASSTNFNGTGTVLSSSTTNGNLTVLTVSGLSVNTSYFFRTGSLNWNSVLNFTASGSSSTLANVPASPAFGGVFVSSVTANWGVPAGGAEGYQLHASTASEFTGTILSSSTSDGNATSLTVVSLQSDTTYYFRVGSLNWDGVANFTTVGSTKTLVSVDTTAPNPVTDLSASTDTATTALLRWSAPLDHTNNPLDGTYAIQYDTWTGVA